MSSTLSMRTFELEPLGDYSLRESAEFIDAWHEVPSDGESPEGHLHLAFLSDSATSGAGMMHTRAAG